MLILESNVTPPITVAGDGAGGLAQFLQPRIYGDLAGVPVVYAPYGDPSGIGTVVFAAVLFLAIYGAYKLIR